MIKKEWRCKTHGDFESGLGICPACGLCAQRVFLTAPGLGFGVAKRTDRILEGEFARRNISNYSNVGSKPRVNYGSGEYNGIRAGWGKHQLANIQQQYAPMMPPGVSLIPPALPPGSNQPHGVTEKNAEPWGKYVPSEKMDLTPNE